MVRKRNLGNQDYIFLTPLEDIYLCFNPLEIRFNISVILLLQ